ncbi:MAG: transglutaminase family protein [Cellulosilyticaceae bacterium]
MFSNQKQSAIMNKFEQRIPMFDGMKDIILEKLAKCTAKEQILMCYLYGTMPLSDSANYDFNTFYDYAKHGLFLWENSYFSNSIPEDIFLQYILYHRVNEEEITCCRDYFYKMISHNIKSKDMQEIALEINYWCAEHVTYQSTDERTASPRMVFESGYGGCGEESTFVVSALRSMGIPARQVYAPRWSHCDDNHAWVEVWHDGEWHFMGGCEPEEVLNKGWFTTAASRAMLIHSRYFDDSPQKEPIVAQNGSVMVLNQLKRYAPTHELEIIVKNKNRETIENAAVRIEVFNYGTWATIAKLKTNQEGKVKITLGIGSVSIKSYKEQLFGEKLVYNQDLEQVTIILAPLVLDEKWCDFNFVAPSVHLFNIIKLTDEQKLQSEKRLLEANKKRHQKVSLKLTRSNRMEIQKFLLEETTAKEVYWKEQMLMILSHKDYQDCKSDVLLEHLKHALQYVKAYPHEIFIPYLLNPRISIEPLTNYREFIDQYYCEDEKKEFKENPTLIWQKINCQISFKEAQEYENLITSPVGCLKVNAGSEQSKKILCVAICRSLGIPAKLDAVDQRIVYYKDGKFQNLIGNMAHGRLVLRAEENAENLIYQENWSLSRIQEGKEQVLGLSDNQFVKGEMLLDLEPGNYRLITSTRLPNGDTWGRQCCFRLLEKEKKNICLQFRTVKLSDRLIKVPLKALLTSKNIGDTDKTLLMWLDVGKEPTEHILNEILVKELAFKKLQDKIIMTVNNKTCLENDTLEKIHQTLPKIKIQFSEDEDCVIQLAQKMGVECEKLPLIIVVDNNINGIYAASGYNVGTAEMLLRIFSDNN